MVNFMTWLLMSGLSLLLAPAATADAPEPVTLTGKVVELRQALQGRGLAFDPEPVAKQVALLGDDGTITPLLSTDASRALFQDERLRNRSAEIKGNRFRNLPYLQVVSFQIEDHGKLCTPEYYCEICTISVRYPVICPCCQGPMVLRMKPEAP
jgi:hypothetical protein